MTDPKQHKLPDVLAPDLVLVFCGSAAGSASAAVGQYYAGPGNRFWKVLHSIDLTDTQLDPSEYARLLDIRVGLTDLVKDQSGMDKHVLFGEASYLSFENRIRKYQPRYLCFNGKRAAQEYLGRKVSYGPQPEKVGETKLFVLPSTSGAANGFWDVNPWQRVAELYHRVLPYEV